MVHEHISLPDDREDVALVLAQPCGRDRGPRRVVMLGQRQGRDFVQRAVVDQAGRLVNVALLDLHFLGEEAQQPPVRIRSDLHAHHRRKSAIMQLLLDLRQQVLRVLVITLHVGVARYPERQHVQNLHAGKEILKIVAHDLTQQHEPRRPLDPVPLRHDLRDLHPRKKLVGRFRSAQHQPQRDAQIRDEREAMTRIHRQRREDREHVVPIPLPNLALLILRQIGVIEQLDPDRPQGRQDFRPVAGRLPLDHRDHALADRQQHALRRDLLVADEVDPHRHLPAQTAHPLHEELVQVAREDRQEPQPLQKGRAVVKRLMEHAIVELQPLQLAVEELRFLPLLFPRRLRFCRGRHGLSLVSHVLLVR